MRNKFFVIDTNILISAFLFKNSTTKSAYDKIIESGRIVSSIDTYNEFCDVLIRPKFDRYISLETRLNIINDFKEISIFKDISETITDCRDPKDNNFLELAIAANASCIITGDDDLLVLNPFRNIPILNATDFLNSE
jgi:putative PIN family toxin of toxin-antitoxin system